MQRVKIGSTTLRLAEPVTKAPEWIGSPEPMDQLLACWTLITDDDLPMTPRIVGKPGMGKTTLAQAAGHTIGRPVYIFQCTMDTRPEDLLVTPVLGKRGEIHYHASPLVSAMIRGGIAILDESNRMPEKSWASLAPLLDQRRYVESQLAGVRIPAHPEFRACVTMNDDASTYEVPDYIVSRLQPLIELDFPNVEDERRILNYNVQFAPEDLLSLTADFLAEARRFRLAYTTRDGINIMRLALKLRDKDLAKDTKASFGRAIEGVLGKGAQNLEAVAKGQVLGPEIGDWSDFFTEGNDPEASEDDDAEESR